MLTKHRIVNVVVVLSATVTLACSERAGSPTAPSSLASTSSQPTVQVSPAQPSEVWNITMRLETASGNECVAETMQSEIGVPKSYTLSVARKGDTTVNVTLRSASGDYACTFPAMAEPDGFTTVGVPGWLSCEAPGLIRGFRCSDGTLRDLMSFGENISGRISGTEITGNWSVSWIVIRAGGDLGGMDDVGSVETVAQFNGRQQRRPTLISNPYSHFLEVKTASLAARQSGQKAYFETAYDFGNGVIELFDHTKQLFYGRAPPR